MTRILVDGDVYAYTLGFAVENRYDWGDGVIHHSTDRRTLMRVFDRQMAKLRKKFVVDQEDIIICLSDDGNNFRKELYPDYKANRKELRKPEGLVFLKEYMTTSYGAEFWPNIEADDMLGIICTDNNLEEAIIVTKDKDLLQMPVDVYNPFTDIMEKASERNFERIHMYQTLIGDTVDNYKGCPGIGPKRAIKILEGVATKNLWEPVLEAFKKKGLKEEDALLQARLAYILQNENYDRETGEVKLWSPN